MTKPWTARTVQGSDILTADSPLEDFPWTDTTRARLLRNAGFDPKQSLRTFATKTSELELSIIPSVGKVTLAQIKSMLADFDLQLRRYPTSDEIKQCPTCGSILA